MIDLKPEYLALVKRILSEQAPGCQARIFGSRVAGNPRPYSDIDIALVGEEKLDWHLLENVKQAFSESDLPYKVDVLDWRAVSEDFRKIIDCRYEIV